MGDTLHLSEWLEEQKQRANDRIADDRVSDEETWRWKGERDLIDSLQSYLEMEVLDTGHRCFTGAFQLGDFERMMDSEHIAIQDYDRMGSMSNYDVFVSFCVRSVDTEADQNE